MFITKYDDHDDPTFERHNNCVIVKRSTSHTGSHHAHTRMHIIPRGRFIRPLNLTLGRLVEVMDENEEIGDLRYFS